MLRGMIRISPLVIVLVLLSGCGGSSSGGSSSGGSGGGGGNNGTTVTFTITGSPTGVATQIGAGAFTAATLSDNKLTLSLPEGTTNFAVAYVCPPLTMTFASPPETQEFDETVIEASTLDGNSFTGYCNSLSSSSESGTLTGTVDTSAISGINSLGIYAQNSEAEWGETLSTSNGSFSFYAPAGTDRVLLEAYETTGGSPEGEKLLAVKNFSSQSVPGALNGGNPVVLGAADQTTQEPISFQNLPAGVTTPFTDAYYELNGFESIYDAYGYLTAYQVLPAGAVEGGDSYYFSSTANVSNTQATNGTGEVFVEMTSTSGGPISFSFPSAWTYAGPKAAAWPSFDVGYTGFSSTTDVCDHVSMVWTLPYNSQDIVTNEVQVTASANYLAGSTTVAIPDLTGLTNFLAAPASQTMVSWGADVYQGNSPCFQSLGLNESVKGASVGGTYTAP